MRIIILSILLVICCVNMSFTISQNKGVSGKIVSSKNGKPLSGVNVIVKGTTNGTISDIDGNFFLSNAPSDGTLVFSFIGYSTQEIAVNNQTSFSISMKEDTSELDEIVVVGYGTQKKLNLTGSISTVNLEDAENRPITDASQALAGQAAGVNVSQLSGQPGKDSANIRIRGIGTLGNANPLVLIDGIEGKLENVNVANIESITVLKDAASAAIYGSRAANGVILITTKKGKKGKFTVNYNSYVGFQSPTKITKYVTNSVQLMELYNKAITNESPGAAPFYSEDKINEYKNGTDPYKYSNTDWQDIMYRNAQIMTHNLSFRGGGKKTNYSFSMGYIDQDGIFLGTNTKKYSSRLNLDTKVSDKFNYSLKISGRHTDVNEPVVGATSVITWTNQALPMDVPYLANGRYGSRPLPAVLEGKNNTIEDNLLVNLSGEYEIIEGLKLKSTVGFNTYHTLQKIFRPKIDVINPNSLTMSVLDVGGLALSAWNKYTTSRDITLVSTLNYKETLGEVHNFEAIVGFNQETNKYQNLEGSKSGISNNELKEISAGTKNPTSSGESIDFGLQSFFGRINYNFDGKYLFEANVRLDGSSNFGEGNKWGVFPSFSVGWNIHKESFMEVIDVINNLKLRASYGQLGNQAIDANQYSPFYSLKQYSFGGTLVGGASQTNLPNPDVTWETSTQTDIGFDLTVYDGLMGLVVDYYKKSTDDILRRINISNVIGDLLPPTVNLASVENKGWEVLVNHKNSIGEFDYSASVNFTTVNNKITKIPAPEISEMQRLAEGSSINEFYTIKMLGIFQNDEEVTAHKAQPTAKPGDIKFEDLNKDGKIDDNDKQPIGQSIPDFTYGFNLSASYKGIDISMIWQGVEGINAITEEEQKPFLSYSLPQFWADNAWTAENPNNSYPRLVKSNSYHNNVWRDSSFLVEDASYLRLKNIQIGYSLPQSILKKIRLIKVRVYINATNPLTFTKYRGLDPEKEPYIRRGSYSNAQVYSAGLSISI